MNDTLDIQNSIAQQIEKLAKMESNIINQLMNISKKQGLKYLKNAMSSFSSYLSTQTNNYIENFCYEYRTFITCLLMYIDNAYIYDCMQTIIFK